MILTIFIIVILAIISFFILQWLTHYYSMFNMYGRNRIVSNSFNEFKREFYNYEWQRDLDYKFSFFSTEKDPIKRIYSRRQNEIHASIIIVNNIQFRFRPFNFIRYSIFLFKNRTTINNYKEVVNNLRQKRRNKLQKLQKIAKNT